MKTPEEIKRGMECCRGTEECDKYIDCSGCPNNAYTAEEFYHRAHISDAIAYIQQLEQDNAQKDERIRQLEREKEALLNSVSRLCIYCKNQGVPSTNEPCYSCVRTGRNNWEWRGVEEDEA